MEVSWPIEDLRVCRSSRGTISVPAGCTLDESAWKFEVSSVSGLMESEEENELYNCLRMSGTTGSPGFGSEGAAGRDKSDWTSATSGVELEGEAGDGKADTVDCKTPLLVALGTGEQRERLHARKSKWRRRAWSTAAKETKIVLPRVRLTYQGHPCLSSDPSGQSTVASHSDVLRMHLLPSMQGQR